ncbi:MAG: hypothetical protein ACNI3C_03845 [Candidatus Marinarcus sp.]|uniref:hypothetical protein n=1 Tax=Candidatus Marinarcus sp. TaxID=3100987 RepID=UPI003AFF72B1
MIEIASKIVLCLLIASVIGFFIGFLIGRSSRQNKPSQIKNMHDFKVQGNIYNKPIILSKPRPTGEDDLKEIEGIDFKTEEELNHLGIFHYDQIAKWSDKNCEWISEYLCLENRIQEEKWVEQAKVLNKKR